MRSYRVLGLTALILYLLTLSSVGAETVTPDEAEQVATNWISTVISSQGKWGDYEEAYVGEIEEVWQDERLLGYCCHIDPGGYIIVPIHKAMAPVKAFMTRGRIDPTVDAGAVALTKDVLECMVDFVEAEYGPLSSVSADELMPVLEVDYSDTWRRFNVETETFKEDLETRSPGARPMNAMGDILLTSVWDQCAHPYNSWVLADTTCGSGHCCSGCTSLAAAQIMHYWNWPPYGQEMPYEDPYTWSAMPDSFDASAPPGADLALAELCYEAGSACSTVYCRDGGCGSSASVGNMRDAFQTNFRYQTNMYLIWRGNYDADQWWPFVTGQIDAGCPAEYTMTDHAMVLDGYWEELGSNRFYHFNMGWGGTGSPADPCWDPYPYTNTWYAMNSIPCNDPDHAQEFMLGNIRPIQLLSSPVSGTFPRPAFPYRYFDDGLTSTGAVFESGQYLQFRRDARFICGHPGPIVFNGTSTGGSTYLYNNGDPTRGIRIDNGAVVLNWGGQMKLHWNN